MTRKNPIEAKWLNIKTKFKSGEYDLNELDTLTSNLIAHLAQLTEDDDVEIVDDYYGDEFEEMEVDDSQFYQ